MLRFTNQCRHSKYLTPALLTYSIRKNPCSTKHSTRLTLTQVFKFQRANKLKPLLINRSQSQLFTSRNLSQIGTTHCSDREVLKDRLLIQRGHRLNIIQINSSFTRIQLDSSHNQLAHKVSLRIIMTMRTMEHQNIKFI